MEFAHLNGRMVAAIDYGSFRDFVLAQVRFLDYFMQMEVAKQNVDLQMQMLAAARFLHDYVVSVNMSKSVNMFNQQERQDIAVILRRWADFLVGIGGEGNFLEGLSQFEQPIT